MLLQRGDIVLVSFPFTDLSTDKIRPAVIISVKNDVDVTVAFISSLIPEKATQSEFVLSENHSDFHSTGLKKTSLFKMNKILTLERAKVLRKIGKVTPAMQKELDDSFKNAFGIQ